MDIPIINDIVYEYDKIFALEISVPEATVRAGVIDGCDLFTARRTVRIIDDDGKLYIDNMTLSLNVVPLLPKI